jgi:hypothetical protein
VSDDTDIVRLGKLAIVHQISKAERNGALPGALQGNAGEVGKCDSTWASKFLGMALSTTRSVEIASVLKSVTVIDFNYDRVLPQYLHWALRYNYNVSEDDATKKRSRVKNTSPVWLTRSVGRMLEMAR